MVQLGPPQEAVSDVLVIGSGAAGLRAAIAARGHGARVLLLSESPVGFRSNSAIARAIFATVGVWSGPGDSAESHLEDTLSGGRLINDRRLVLTMTRAVRRQVDDLQQFGVSFRRRGEELLVGRAPGHSYPRHVSVEANRGVNITRPMRHHAASVGVDFLEGVTVTRLLLAGDRVAGALGIDGRGQVFVVNAGSTVLATGGGGKTYLRTNNAAGSSGDGYVLAYEAGATLQDMEFVQFYPTAWGDRGTKMCFYEGLLPIGATIRNSLGEDILARHGIDDAATVTRDVLTRMISQEIAEGRGVDGHVIFDLTTVPGERARALQYGRMMSHTGDQDRIPVAPTVHHFMGGIKIGVTAETGAPGLWAAGEVCGGVHGANRLGGNALTETFVFGTIAGERAAAAAGVGWAVLPRDEVEAEIARLNGLVAGGREEDLDLLERSLRTVMWEKAGVIRDGRGLEEACREIETLRERLAAASVADPAALVQAVKLSAMLAVGEMVCRAAWLRAESRGAHYRSDYPDEDNGRWLKNIEISCRGGQMVLDSSPVSIETGR